MVWPSRRRVPFLCSIFFGRVGRASQAISRSQWARCGRAWGRLSSNQYNRRAGLVVGFWGAAVVKVATHVQCKNLAGAARRKSAMFGSVTASHAPDSCHLAVRFYHYYNLALALTFLSNLDGSSVHDLKIWLRVSKSFVVRGLFCSGKQRYLQVAAHYYRLAFGHACSAMPARITVWRGNLHCRS